jgi:hypothetical protein
VVDSAGNVYSGTDQPLGIYKSTYSNGNYVTTNIGAPLDYFYCLFMDASGNIYTGDLNTGVIYKITVNSGGTYTFTSIITTSFEPAGIVVDGYGNVYVSNYSNSVFKYIYNASANTYTQQTLASDMSEARNMAITPDGVLYVADQGASSIRQLTPVGPVATTTTYTETTPFTGMSGTAGVQAKNGIIYIGTDSQLIMETPNGSGGYIATVFASGFNSVRGIAIDLYGNVFAADLNNSKCDCDSVCTGQRISAPSG